jgi:ornithine cyclodeaminase/alanine dehydrogenase-like protein (mu-crystallin family)
LILGRREIAALMRPPDWLAAVEAGFRALADGDADLPLPMHIPAADAAFHVKGARLMLDGAPYVAVKLNGNFPHNPERNGLPTIQGAVLLCDGSDGSVLAMMDSVEITLRRTAAASALAARFLARDDADSIAICGCGEQGRAQLEALAQALPLERVRAWDVDPERARTFAAEMNSLLDIDVDAVADVGAATRSAAVIVTATPARVPYLSSEIVPAGAFVAAVGADSADKSELTPELLGRATIVVDRLAQCAAMGDLHHAIEAGVVTTADVKGELGDLVLGRRNGRTRPDEITVFDSTGTAVQDAASAVSVYRRALASGAGQSIVLNAV